MIDKTVAANETLARRFHGGFSSGADCVAIFDVIRFACDGDPLPAVNGLPDFYCLQSHRIKRGDLKFLAYARAHWFASVTTRMKFAVETERLAAWLSPATITLYADDRLGLVPDDVLHILSVVPKTRIVWMELALDFSPLTRVCRAFVRRHGIFGKSRRAFS